ncbi:MAG: DUF3450 domain-containing protein [Opitutales bacterium]
MVFSTLPTLWRVMRPVSCSVVLFGSIAVSATRAQDDPPEPPPPPATTTDTDLLEASIEEGVQRTRNAADTEETVTVLADETAALLDEYKLVLRQLEVTQAYNRQMEEIVGSQNEEIANIRAELDELGAIQREILPLLNRMIAQLERFIEADTPFLLDERLGRVASLDELMGRGDISLAEKFRKVFEAYQIENDLARNIEAYTDTIKLNNQEVTVDFLRFGRVGLYFQSLDGQTTGFWNRNEGDWEILEGDEYRIGVGQALRIAKKQAAQDLLKLPVPAPVDVE